MKFLIDAQLPRRLALWLRETGHDTCHTLDLPLANATPDSEVVQRAVTEQRVVVTKDNDFVQSFLLTGMPPRLLLVSTGNISNAELNRLLRDNLPAVISALETHRFVEINRNALVIHE